MKAPSAHWLLISILLIGSFCAPAQSLSTEGTDFWFGFMNNWDTDPQNNPILLEVYISAEDSTSGTLEMPNIAGFTPRTFNVIPGQTTLITLPSTTAMAGTQNGIENKGIHVQSEGSISVYAINKRQYSADETVILPTYSLSNEYIVMSHWEDGNRNNNNNSNSEMLIVATANNTLIEITPSVNTLNNHPANQPYTITLQRGQSYHVMARGDLTGTKVTGLVANDGRCYNFAVFGGNQYTQVGECDEANGHDHLFAQMFPVRTWGREYIVVNYEPRSGGDIVKVLAQEDNTTVSIAGENVVLQSGKFVKRLLDGINTISSDKPISVGQFSRTEGCDNSTGDPFQIMLSPNEQLLKKITFNAPGIVTVSTYSLNVIAPTIGINNLLLDGRAVASSFQYVPGNQDYVYARFSITGGNHNLTSSRGFIAYVYGYGNNESFGYSAGASLANLNLIIEVRNSDGVLIHTDEACHGDLLSFTPVTEFSYQEFRWSFGDGTVLTSFDKNPVFHAYDLADIYNLKLTGYSEGNGCQDGNEETISGPLGVINPMLPILGPKSVCPFTEDVLYVTKNPFNLTNEWYVSGGKITASYRDSVRVNWGATNDSGKVKLLSSDLNSCFGDTVIFPVKINLKLEPSAPLGTDSICSSALNNHVYTAYYFTGSVYDWHVEGGTLASPQGIQLITVNWDGPGVGKLWYDQSVPGADICEGTSDTLFVSIQRTPNPNLTIVTDRTDYQIGETGLFSVEADSLYQFVQWRYDNQILQDSALLSQNITLDFSCSGTHRLEALAYDTLGVCSETAMNSLDIFINPPLPRIIRVSNDTSRHDLIWVDWTIENTDFGDFNYVLNRTGGNLLSIALDEGQPTVADSAANTASAYHYDIQVSETSCNEFFRSETHANIVLKNIKGQAKDRARIEWSDYVGWAEGVEQYEVYLSVDEHPYTLIDTRETTYLDIENEDLGLDHCFRIRAVEKGGNQSDSWSNEVCVLFAPELHPYNVFTPNGDGKNETFIIDHVEIFKKSKLSIMDRSGNLVHEVTNYQNDWNGGKLPPGVYYFMLELNEPRIEKKLVHGYFSILK